MNFVSVFWPSHKSYLEQLAGAIFSSFCRVMTLKEDENKE